MGILRVHEFITLDGVIDNPTWTVDFGFDSKMGEAIARAMDGCSGILLGRKTYEMFAPAWSGRTAEEDPGAPFMNDTTKYVVSSTLHETIWANSEIIDGYDQAVIQKLKGENDRGLYLSGSGTLVRQLLDDCLVDELHLCLYPFTRGPGPRLFNERAKPTTWKLVDCENYENGVLYLHYRFVSSE